MDYHLIILAVAALYWAGVGIYRFFQWIARSVAGAGVTPSPLQQAMTGSQQTATPQMPTPPGAMPALPRPQATPWRVPPPSAPAWQMPRQPLAGPPAVPWETTSEDFQRQELALMAEEPTGLNVPLQSAPVPDAPPALRLFETDNDLLRAIILQEALGPPLSRRR